MISWAASVKKSLAGECEIKKKDAETLLMQNAHSNTSKTQVGQPSNNSITDSTEKVNSETKFSYKTPAESKVYKRIAEWENTKIKDITDGTAGQALIKAAGSVSDIFNNSITDSTEKVNSEMRFSYKTEMGSQVLQGAWSKVPVLPCLVRRVEGL